MSLASSIHELLVGGSTGTYSYTINNSLRFRSSATAYLNRTPASAGNRRTWTYSLWHKRGQIGAAYSYLMTSYNTTQDSLDFNADRLDFWLDDGNSIRLTSSSVYRDPSAWYHIVLAFDSTQATSSDRIKMYINGVQLTNFYLSNYPSLNYQCNNINNSILHQIGYSGGATDGYMAEVNFIDGLALDPSYFGATNSTTGTWAPKRYSGSYGTNGFYLPFSDTSGTTSGSNTGLGKDFSGNGNYFNSSNISLTAGSTYDAMLDSPTPKSTTVGNYAVLNPLDKGSDITASDGNLSISWGGVNGHSIRDSIAMSSGQWYCELTMGTSSVTMGLIAQNITGVSSGSGWPGSSTFGAGGSYGYANSGNKYTNSVSSSYGASYTTGDVIGVAFDASAGTLTFYKNGSSQGTAFTGISGAYCFAIGYFGGSSGGTPAYANFGQRPFAYTPPTGYNALQTYNLSTPTIKKGNQYFDATTYTGNGATQSITNSGFQPDLVWIKDRSGTYNPRLVDSVRGVGGPVLYSNLANAEGTDTTGVTAINSNGFAVGADAGYNKSADAYIGWQWKAGGNAVTNTNGSISSQVSANPTAGFSVVTYTGNGTNPGATIGHGLGVTPSMIITKSRNATGEWPSYHQALPVSNTLYLNATYDSSTYVNRFSAVSSTTFTTGSNGSELNSNGTTYIAYCFAAIPGYSAFGSYTGNGSSSGPFVYCGFLPRFILIRSTTSNRDWIIWDTARNPYNIGTAGVLFPDTNGAEYSGGGSYAVAVVSNGFYLPVSTVNLNANGESMIYAAFAENPFNYSLAR